MPAFKMFRRNLLVLVFGLLLIQFTLAQQGVIKGRIYNGINNEPIPYATITIESLGKGSVSDDEGFYRMSNIEPGVYVIKCTFLGFQDATFAEITISSARITTLNIPMIEELEELDAVTISTANTIKSEKSTVSLKIMNATEIYRSPGGNRDISKVIQLLPGVATTVSFRNDLLVRGGAPNENRFYMDGIEIPNINHFATQGSSGGPVGMLNVNFIRSVEFYSGAFPANRGNALSSVIEFNQINGNDERLEGTLLIGSSDMGLTLNGPWGKNSTFIFSARRSYLQFLFKALKLPFLPTYSDFQFKSLTNIDSKNQLTVIGLGAIDDFELNKTVNDDVDDTETRIRNEYILNNLPINQQRNYAVGLKWTHFTSNGFQNVIMSRNHLKNEAIKYRENIETPDRLLLDYLSTEGETKFRYELTRQNEGWTWNIGGGFEHANYTNRTLQYKPVTTGISFKNFDSSLSFNKYSMFAQVTSPSLANKFLFVAGLRTDFNNYSGEMNKPFDQLSPRLSLAYKLQDALSLNFSLARFYQLPPYTVMGYRNSNNELVNKNNAITFIQSDHIVGGIAYLLTDFSKINLEGFYKTYKNYPFLVDEQISLANLGGDFGVIGNDEVTSTSKGRSYGLEFLFQQKLSTSVYGLLSYTFVRSEFKDGNDTYVPSSWDNRHVLNLTAGKKLSKNWEIGLKFRYLGGGPYTPYNREQTGKKDVWNTIQQGVYDWRKLNQNRNPDSHGLDIRIDKKWYFKKSALNIYLDVQNVYNSEVTLQDYLDVQRDNSGIPIEDPQDNESYLLRSIENTSGTVLPSIGIMFEF
jgi:outer membrane receptor for ferrienterochelin and colicin